MVTASSHRVIPALASSRAAVEASATVDHAAASSAHGVAAAAHAVAAVASGHAEQHLSLFSAHGTVATLHRLGARPSDIAAAVDDVVMAATVLSAVAMLDGFNEADHPREDDGKFTDSGGGGEGGGKPSGGGSTRTEGGDSSTRRESNVGARAATAKAGKAHDAYRATGNAAAAKAAVEAHQAAAAAHREAAKQSAGTHETAHHNTAGMHERAAARIAKEAGLPEPKMAAPPAKTEAPKTERMPQAQDKPAAKPADPKPAVWHEKETPQAIAQRGQAANAATERAVHAHTPEAHREAAQVNHDAAAHLRDVAASAPPKEAAKLRELADIRTELAKGHERVANEAFGPKGGEPKAEAAKPAAEQDKPKGDDAPAHDKPAAVPVVVPVGGGGQDAGSKPADAPPGEQKPADAPSGDKPKDGGSEQKPKGEEPKPGKGQDDKPAAKPAGDTRVASKHEGPGIAAKMAHLMAMLAKVTAELLLMHKHPSLGGKITGEGYTPPKGKSTGAPKSDAAKGDTHASDAAKAAAAAHNATKKAEGATSATATEAHKAAAKAHDEAAKAERASGNAHEKAGDKKSASEAFGREAQHNDRAKSHRDAAGRLERGEPERPRKHETTSILDALDAIAMLYSEDQARDADGRFGSGGGAATGEMTPVGGGHSRGDSTGEMTPVGGRGGNPFAGAGKPMSGVHTRETRDKAERDRQHEADHKHMATEARGLAQRATEIAAERSHRTKDKDDHATHERAHAMNRVAAGAHRIAAQLNPEHAAEHHAMAAQHDKAADAHEQAMVRHHPDGKHEAASVAALSAASKRKPGTYMTLRTADAAPLRTLLTNIEKLGAPGHSFGIVADETTTGDNLIPKSGEKIRLGFWDGDGHDRVEIVAVETVERERAELSADDIDARLDTELAALLA